MARVGRARARLDLKKLTEAAADAILVPAGFVRNAEFTEGGAAQRENRIYNLTIRNDYLSVAAPYRNLTVNGVAGNVPDPRVKVKDAGKKANDGVTPLFQQQKFIAQTGGTPIPIASWNEAQLIYAEAVGGQAGLDAINRVRTANGVPTLAGPAPTGQAFTDLVLEERRRQLFSEGQRYGDMLRYNLPVREGCDAQGATRTAISHACRCRTSRRATIRTSRRNRAPGSRRQNARGSPSEAAGAHVESARPSDDARCRHIKLRRWGRAKRRASVS